MNMFNEILFNKVCEYEDTGWFSKADKVYIQYISDTKIFSIEELQIVRESIIESQDNEGYISDRKAKKSHNKYHSTAYALATLSLIDSLTESYTDYKKILTPLHASLDPTVGKVENLGLLNRAHQWRGSHTFGGICAIQYYLKKYDFPTNLDLLHYYQDQISTDGLLNLTNPVVSICFDSLYVLRHRPDTAKFGAVAHLYWMFDRKNLHQVDSLSVLTAINALVNSDGSVEAIPYCLDYDLLYILRFFLESENKKTEAYQVSILTLNKCGHRIYNFIMSNSSKFWLHAIPGALAALQVCAYSEDFSIFLDNNNIKLNNIMDETIWI